MDGHDGAKVEVHQIEQRLGHDNHHRARPPRHTGEKAEHLDLVSITLLINNEQRM
jgi:hypothetical protein